MLKMLFPVCVHVTTFYKRHSTLIVCSFGLNCDVIQRNHREREGEMMKEATGRGEMCKRGF